MLVILGLGPGNPSQRTLEAAEILAEAERIILRTGVHPGLDDLLADERVTTCDDLYESHESFDSVYSAITERVLRAMQDGDVVFAVPGNPVIGERSVLELVRMTYLAGITVRIVPGISAIDASAGGLTVDPLTAEAQLIDAAELQQWVDREPFNGGLPDISPTRPVLLSQVYSPSVAAAAKLALSRVFPDDHPITVARSCGLPESQRVEKRRLFELDRIPVDHLTSVWIEPQSRLEATRSPLTLFRIAARLRAADGCPWDRAQTHASLRDSAIEEAYEVASAIDDGDPHHLAEELGDLLLHVAMQAQIAEESGTFSIGEVFDEVNRKLIRRHPHVFGTSVAATPEAVVRTWDEVKEKERADRGLVGTGAGRDPLDALPKSMPVMRRIATVMRGQTPQSWDQEQREALADELLERVIAMSSAGVDPEHALEAAYRRKRTTDTGGTAA